MPERLSDLRGFFRYGGVLSYEPDPRATSNAHRSDRRRPSRSVRHICAIFETKPTCCPTRPCWTSGVEWDALRSR